MEGVEEVTAVMIDLNCLTYYNGLGGHLCGSEAIRILAEIIQEVSGDFTPYRYAGDEFTIIIKGNQDEAKTIVGAIQERLSKLDLTEKKSEIKKSELPLSISVGMATKQETEQRLTEQKELDPDKSKFQILAELITDIADQRSLTEKQAHHRAKIQELYEQNQKKCWQLIPYLLKGAKLRGEEVEVFLKQRPEHAGIV